MTTEGINIVLAIDLSSSMLAQDFQPQNRLEVAKDVVKRFIAARTSDPVGLFGSQSQTRRAPTSRAASPSPSRSRRSSRSGTA